MDKIIVTTQSELSNLIEEAMQKTITSVNACERDDYLPEYLTISQAASYLNLAKQTLYGFTSNRVIPFIKKGKKLYFKKTQLDDWLTEETKEAVHDSKTEALRRFRGANYQSKSSDNPVKGGQGNQQ